MSYNKSCYIISILVLKFWQFYCLYIVGYNSQHTTLACIPHTHAHTTKSQSDAIIYYHTIFEINVYLFLQLDVIACMYLFLYYSSSSHFLGLKFVQHVVKYSIKKTPYNKKYLNYWLKYYWQYIFNSVTGSLV